jgi:hypothetical protein
MEEPAKVAKVVDDAARNAMVKQSEIEKASTARQRQ